MTSVYLDNEIKIIISDNKMKNNKTNFNNELKNFI